MLKEDCMKKDCKIHCKAAAITVIRHSDIAHSAPPSFITFCASWQWYYFAESVSTGIKSEKTTKVKKIAIDAHQGGCGSRKHGNITLKIR